jgi:hypothetical protein
MEITHDVKLSTLKPHPLNAEIYGEPDKKLMEDIEKNGLLTPIVINSKNVIISGHRRWKAMLALGFTATDAIVRDFQDELDEQEKLIAYNQQREKTASQIFAEAEKLKEIETKRAKKRQATGHYNAPQYGGAPVVETIPELEKGHTRDKIAKKIGAGVSGRILENGLKIYEAAKQGNEQAKESLKKLDNKESTITTEFKKLFKSEERKAPQPQTKVVNMKPKKEKKIKPDPDLTEQQLKDALWMESVYKEVDSLYCEMFRRNEEMVRAWALYWRKYRRMEHCLGLPERLTGLLELLKESLRPSIEMLKIEFEKEMSEYNASPSKQ